MTFLDSEVEYQLQRHRKEDSIVTLNVGGTRYEVRAKEGRETSLSVTASPVIVTIWLQ